MLNAGFHASEPTFPLNFDWIPIDTLMEFNKFINVMRFISINTNFAGGTHQRRIAVVNNLALQVASRSFYLFHVGDDVRLEHNTVVPIDSPQAGDTGYFIGADGTSGTSWPNLTIRRNAFAVSPARTNVQDETFATPQTLAGWNAVLPTRDFAENAEFGEAGTYPGGFTRYASAVAAGINLSDGKLTVGSPLRAANGGSSDGKDVGVDHDELEAVLAGGGGGGGDLLGQAVSDAPALTETLGRTLVQPALKRAKGFRASSRRT